MIRIILKNMDKKNYGIYGFSMALFSSIIYIIASLISINGIINLGAGSENVRIVFAFYYVVIACTGLPVRELFLCHDCKKVNVKSCAYL